MKKAESIFLEVSVPLVILLRVGDTKKDYKKQIFEVIFGEKITIQKKLF